MLTLGRLLDMEWTPPPDDVLLTFLGNVVQRWTRRSSSLRCPASKPVTCRR